MIQRVLSNFAAAFAVATLFLISNQSFADTIEVELSGYEEVPSVSTEGEGFFSLEDDGNWTLEYDLEDDNEITQAHIHFAQEGVNGGIMVWLCVNSDFATIAANAPEGTVECDDSSDTVRGDIDDDDIIGPEEQGIDADDDDDDRFDEFAEALNRGLTYVNVHSNRFPDGEIRGQIDDFDNDDDDDDNDNDNDDDDDDDDDDVTSSGNPWNGRVGFSR